MVMPFRMGFFLKRFAAAAAVLLLLFSGAIHWLESPRGAGFLSRRVTAQIGRQVPEAVVTIARIRWHWPLTFRLWGVHWGIPGRTPILRLDWAIVSAAPSWHRFDRPVWSGEAQVGRLDLAALDQALAQGKWQARGDLAGRARFHGTGPLMEQADLQLTTLSGGTLSSEILQQLLNLMPQGDARGKLLGAVQAKASFHFDVGRIEVATEGSSYRFNFLLDGDHLLDVTILVPKEGLGILNQLLNLR